MTLQAHKELFRHDSRLGFTVDCFTSKKREKKHDKSAIEASLLCHFLAVTVLKLLSTWADADGFGCSSSCGGFANTTILSVCDGEARKQISTFPSQLKTLQYKQTSPSN
jgi:hypothetical protein